MSVKRGLVAVVVAVVLGLGVLKLFEDGGGDGAPTPAAVTVRVDGADRDDERDDTITVPERLVRAVESSEVGDHAGQRDESPSIAPRSELIEARKQQERIRRTQRPLRTGGATANMPGCRTRFVRNQSSRRGVRPQQDWYHYTVTANRPGWSDVDAIVAYFNQRSAAASSHFVIDAEGHCAYIVPIERKAWTQAAANPIAISYEIINSGREGRLMGPAGYRKLAAVTRRVRDRTAIPLRRGRVSGCRSLRRGIVQHKDGGFCAGGHVDVLPYSIAATVRLVARLARRARRTSYLTRLERAVSRKRCYHRRQHLAGRKRKANLMWARRYKARVRALMTKIDRAKARDRKPWSFRHRGSRRKQLAGKFTGKGC